MTKLQADLGLLSVTVFWGSTFIIAKLTMLDVPLLIFLFLRLTLAAILLNAYLWKHFRAVNSSILKHGIIIGIWLYLSYLFQMWGVQYTSASNAAFITALSVVLVPVFGFLFFGYRAAYQVLAAILLAVIGLLLLTGANPLAWNKGDSLVFICSITVAFHIIFTGKYARLHNVYLLTGIQLATVSLLTILALPFNTIEWPRLSLLNVSALFYLALFGTVYTYVMQTKMQRHTTTARTALIFSMEPVFAALFAFIIADEQLTTTGWMGGVLIVISMIIAELPWQQWKQTNKTYNNAMKYD